MQADDGNGGTASATVNINVTDVDEAGVLTGFTLVAASNQSVLATLTGGASVALAAPTPAATASGPTGTPARPSAA